MDEILVDEFKKCGCESMKEIAIGVQVYLELLEVKKYWDIDHFYHSELKKIYFTARKTKNDRKSVFVGIAVSDSQSFEDLQNLFQLVNSTEYQSVHLVFMYNDTTTAYYQITKGLYLPTENKEKNSKRLEKLVDYGLKKYRDEIRDAALRNESVTIPFSLKENPEFSTDESSGSEGESKIESENE